MTALKHSESLSIYAHDATEQQRASLTGQGVPLNFIKDLETGVIDLKTALENVKSHVAADNATEYHTADIHCALAAVHFVVAQEEGYSAELLEEIRNDYHREMKLYFDCSNDDKKSLEENLYRITSTKA